MYQALYRKWRPRTFADVVGQEAITSALANQVAADKIGHAYLFTGTRGTGKTSCAKILASAANCENRNGAEPCGECPMCKGLQDGSILDVLEIDAASNNGVDDVRDLREETIYRPSRGRYRIYIIDEVHMLTNQAFNALLKTLEEPPQHVIFILATTEIHKVPATILSRCQRFDFGRIAPEKIAERLTYIAQQEGITLTADAADLLARLGDGSMRDATSLLDTCAGLGQEIDEALVRSIAGVSDKDYLFKLSDAVQTGGSDEILRLVAALRAQSIDVRRLTEELAGHYRNLLLAAAAPDGALLDSVPKADQQKYLDKAPEISQKQAIRAIRRLAAAMDGMSRSPDPRIELELALFDLGGEAGEGESTAPAAKAPAAAATAGSAAPAAPVKPAPAAPPAAAAPPPPAAAQPQAKTPADEVPFDVTDVSNVMPEAAATAAPAEPPAVPEAGPAAAGTEVEAEEEQAEGEQAEKAPAEAEQQAAPEPPPTAEPTPATKPGPEAAEPDTAEPDTAAEPGVAAAPPPTPADTGTATGPQPFTEWPQVLQRMREKDKMLYAYMQKSSAYLEGGFALIDGGEVFLTFIRSNNEAKEQIRQAIAEVTGKRYNLGPYEAPKTESKQSTAQDTLQNLQAMGVPVEYE